MEKELKIMSEEDFKNYQQVIIEGVRLKERIGILEEEKYKTLNVLMMLNSQRELLDKQIKQKYNISESSNWEIADNSTREIIVK